MQWHLDVIWREVWSKIAPLCQMVRKGSSHMWDVIMLAIGFGLFAVSIGYVYACDRL